MHLPKFIHPNVHLRAFCCMQMLPPLKENNICLWGRWPWGFREAGLIMQLTTYTVALSGLTMLSRPTRSALRLFLSSLHQLGLIPAPTPSFFPAREGGGEVCGNGRGGLSSAFLVWSLAALNRSSKPSQLPGETQSSPKGVCRSIWKSLGRCRWGEGWCFSRSVFVSPMLLLLLFKYNFYL